MNKYDSKGKRIKILLDVSVGVTNLDDYEVLAINHKIRLDKIYKTSDSQI